MYGRVIWSSVMLLCRNSEIDLSVYSFVVPVSTYVYQQQQQQLRGLSPHANYTDRAAAAGRRS